jgi:O-antigen/teichoic acid export membrane protein
MGIVKKQGIPAAFLVYLGVGVAFLNGAILFPRTIGMEIFGFTQWVMAVFALFNIFGDLGSSRILVKYLPYFKKPEENHSAFFFKLFVLTCGGILLSVTLSLGLKDLIIKHFSSDESRSLVEEYYLLLPLGIVFFLLNNYFTAYCRAVTRIRIPTFFTEFFGKYFNTLLLLSFMFGWINTTVFMLLYIVKFGVQTFALFLYIKWLDSPVFGKRTIRWATPGIKPELWEDMKTYAWVTILSGSANIMSRKIDALMVASMIGFVSTGVYSILLYMTTVMNVAYGVIVGSISAMVAESHSKNDMNKLKEVYVKSSQISFLVSVGIFVLTIVNFDTIIAILGSDYEGTHWVYYCLGSGALIFSLCGANGLILNFSKKYKIDIYIKLLFLLLTITMNLLLIPEYGILGAAIATAISVAIYNIALCVLIFKFYKIHPLSWSLLKSASIGLVSVYLGLLLPALDSHVLDILIKTSITLSVFTLLTYLANVSTELNAEVDRVFRRR